MAADCKSAEFTLPRFKSLTLDQPQPKIIKNLWTASKPILKILVGNCLIEAKQESDYKSIKDILADIEIIRNYELSLNKKSKTDFSFQSTMLEYLT